MIFWLTTTDKLSAGYRPIAIRETDAPPRRVPSLHPRPPALVPLPGGFEFLHQDLDRIESRPQQIPGLDLDSPQQPVRYGLERIKVPPKGLFRPIGKGDAVRQKQSTRLPSFREPRLMPKVFSLFEPFDSQQQSAQTIV